MQFHESWSTDYKLIDVGSSEPSVSIVSTTDPSSRVPQQQSHCIAVLIHCLIFLMAACTFFAAIFARASEARSSFWSSKRNARSSAVIEPSPTASPISATVSLPTSFSSPTLSPASNIFCLASCSCFISFKKSNCFFVLPAALVTCFGFIKRKFFLNSLKFSVPLWSLSILLNSLEWRLPAMRINSFLVILSLSSLSILCHTLTTLFHFFSNFFPCLSCVLSFFLRRRGRGGAGQRPSIESPSIWCFRCWICSSASSSVAAFCLSRASELSRKLASLRPQKSG